MSDFLNGLVEVKNKTNRVSDSAVVRRKRILDAKRRMTEKKASGINRISDSARPTMRGIATKRVSAVQGLTRKQDSASKSYLRLRQRIKDELAETETTQEATEAVIDVLDEMVQDNPQEVVNASEDIISAVFEVISELIPEGGNEDGKEGNKPEFDEEGNKPEFDEEEEVSDSVRRCNVVRRRGVADSRKLAMIRRRIKDGLARRGETARRVSVKDSARRSRALAAARRVRDAHAKRTVVRPSVRRAADSRMARRPISRKG